MNDIFLCVAYLCFLLLMLCVFVTEYAKGRNK